MNYNSDAMIKAFGAKIDLSLPDQTLYIVIGREQSPSMLISQLEGQVLFSVPNRPVILALLPISAYFTLRVDSRIKHIGPVSIDSGTFNQFLELIRQQQGIRDS